MKKILLLTVFAILFSCDIFKQKEEHRFVYAFENESDWSKSEQLKTIEVIKTRLNGIGVQNEVKRFGEKHLEVLVKATQLDVQRLDQLIINQGKLEFWELYKGEEFLSYIGEALYIIKESNTSDSLKVTSKFDLSPGYKGGPIVIHVKQDDSETVLNLLNSEASKLNLPSEFKNVKFLLGIEQNGRLPIYAIRSNKDNKAPLTGEVITKARNAFGPTGRPEISIEMNQDGALIWERLTGSAFQKGTSIAITLNNVVYSAPGVTAGPIKGGRSSVSGNFTTEEAQDLAIVLSSGQVIPELKLIEYSVVSNR